MEADSDTNTAHSPLNPIRVETALSRYPVHMLAKTGDINIELNEKDDRGESSLKWRVTYNSGFGQPGPLAYKLDTLIVNRKIEETCRPIPRIISLGSLREIAERLELGGDTNCVKRALRQNASAFIIARIRYKQPDGTIQTLEADFTRYSVVFTGEKLPNGRKADAVYLILNDVYMQVINGAMTRPLDYDYLKELPPAPQRFYELLSFPMYGAIKHGRHRAKLAYSEFCTYAPQTRYFDWEHARKQMAKVHARHKHSGYIAKVEFEPITDSDGHPDWLMFYTPGPKALSEFRAFTKRGGPATVQFEVASIDTAASTPEPLQLDLILPRPRKAAGKAKSPIDLELSPLVAELTRRGVTTKTAIELVEQHPAETIHLKLDVFDWLMEKQDKRVAKSPEGYLVKSITDDYKTPKGFVSAAERQNQAEAKQARERQEAEDHRRNHQEAATEQAKQKRDSAYWAQLTPEQQRKLQGQVDAGESEEQLAKEIGPLKNMGQLVRRQVYIRRLLDEQEQAKA